MFGINEVAILNNNAVKGLPYHIGEKVTIALTKNEFNSPNYDYVAELEDGTTVPVREIELNKLTEDDKTLMKWLYTGNTVLHKYSGDKAKIIKCDYILKQVEVEFLNDGANTVLDFDSLEEIKEELGKFTELALEIGNFTDDKNKQYGSSVDATFEVMKVLMERYKNNDHTYTIPESLLQHILLQVRIMDKINRIFNNPSGEGDSESPYRDLGGYSLIGIAMVEGKN